MKIGRIVLLGSIVVGAFGAFLYMKDRASQTSDPTALAYYGNVEIRRVNMSFRVGGRIEELFAEEGDELAKGQVFARLDRAPIDVEVKAAEGALDNAVAARDQAKAALEKAETGPRKQEIDEARATVEECEAALTLAETDLGRNQLLIEKNAVSQSGVEVSQSTRDGAKARLARAKAIVELLEEGTRKEDVDAARAALAQAEAAVTQAEAALAKAKIAAADAELVAPNDGVLLTRVAEPGAIVGAGQTVATLSVRDVVWVYIFVEEPDLGKIAPGMKAEISTDSSDKVYVGHVGYVAPEAEFTPKTVETPNLRTNLVYRARIVVEAPDLGLRQGSPVDVRIPLAESSQTKESEE